MSSKIWVNISHIHGFSETENDDGSLFQENNCVEREAGPCTEI